MNKPKGEFALNITEEIGNRIRQRRNELDYSQEQLAEYSDLHPSYIGQLERGEKTPSIETLYKITTGLQISLSDFMNGLEDIANKSDTYAYKSYQILERQTAKNQERLYHILRSILELDR